MAQSGDARMQPDSFEDENKTAEIISVTVSASVLVKILEKCVFKPAGYL